MQSRATAYSAAVLLFAWALLTLSAPFAEVCAANRACRVRLGPALLLPHGKLVDVADHQWRAFRSQLPLLMPLALAHSAGGAVMRRFISSPMSRRAAITRYDTIIGVLLIVFIHRAQ